MMLTTPGLVLHTTPHGDTSLIARIFTRQLGLRSYIVKGARTSRSRAKASLLQPLSYLDMVVYNSPHTTLNHIREMRPAAPLNLLAANPVATAVRFFMDELLYRVLKEEEPNEPLFDYTVATLHELDSPSRPDPSLPIRYLLAVARHIGLEPLDDYSPSAPQFSIEEGHFVPLPARPTAPVAQPSAPSLLLHQYLSGPAPQAPLAQRTELLDLLLRYLQEHLSDPRPFHSHEVLHSVLQ